MISRALFCAFVAALAGLGYSQAKEPSVRIEPAVREMLVADGSQETLRCIVENHMQKTDLIEWVRPYYIDPKMNDSLPKKSIMMTDEGKYTTNLVLTLDFTKAREGEYRCILNPADGQREESKIKIQVISETKSDEVYHFGNDTISLHCSASLGESAKFREWIKDNTTLEDGEKYKVHENGTLTIMKLDRDDAGLYKARYTLNEGASDTYDCSVDYTAGPLVLDMDKSINSEETGSVDINCDAKGWPHPKITWMKGEEVLTQVKDVITFSAYHGVSDAKLTISNLKYDDEGIYTCKAYSKKFNMTTQKSIKLRVKDKLAWLWPFLGIIIEGVVLILLILFFEKFRKKDGSAASHPHEQ